MSEVSASAVDTSEVTTDMAADPLHSTDQVVAENESVPVESVTNGAQPGGGHSGGGKSRRQRPKHRRTVPSKPFSCSNQHPIAALKRLHPNAEFAQVCMYSVPGGAAHVYSTTIDGTIYQGEGTTSKIARAFAAAKALEGIQAADYDKVQTVADYETEKEEVLKRIQVWQHNHAASEGKKKQRRNEKNRRNKRKREASTEENAEDNVDDNAEEEVGEKGQDKRARCDPDIDASTTTESKPGNVRYYGQLMTKYGPHISEEYTKLPKGHGCTLTIQGFKFSGEGINKKKARNIAVELAFQAFDENPPPIVRVKQDSTAKRENMRPKEFTDKLAEKNWIFVWEKLASIQCEYKHLRNLVVIIKVEGEESIENCEIVAFGNGSRLINIDNTVTDGTRINDSTGESLALRAMRRYLINQLDECLSDRPSVYQKATGNKFSIRDDVQFVLYNSFLPSGDCRVFVTVSPPPTSVLATETVDTASTSVNTPSIEENSESIDPSIEVKTEPIDPSIEVKTESIDPSIEVKTESIDPSLNGDTTPSIDPSCGDTTPSINPSTTAKSDLSGKRWGRRSKVKVPIVEEDLGKLGYSKRYISDMPHEVTSSHMSPSDKLALRNMCGVQGSLLSRISTPVYISQYLITLDRRAGHSDDTLRRALYERVKGAVLPDTLAPPEPQIKRVVWRTTPNPEYPKQWHIEWNELIHAAKDKQSRNSLYAERRERRTLFACIWAKGFPLETIFVPEGKQFDGTQENVDSKNIVELGILTQSSYCTLQLFTEYKEMCTRHSLNCVDLKYSDIKYSENNYSAAKKAVCKHLEEAGLGKWYERQKPEF